MTKLGFKLRSPGTIVHSLNHFQYRLHCSRETKSARGAPGNTATSWGQTTLLGPYLIEYQNKAAGREQFCPRSQVGFGIQRLRMAIVRARGPLWCPNRRKSYQGRRTLYQEWLVPSREHRVREESCRKESNLERSRETTGGQTGQGRNSQEA